jgi:hypothetical protein
MSRDIRFRSVAVWLLACLLVAGTCGCNLLRKKQERERFEKNQHEFSCGEPMPTAKP